MWLSLFLAAIDDAAGLGVRRAAGHEMARRLGIGWKKEASTAVVPYPVRVCQEAEAIHREGGEAFRRRARLRALGGLCAVLWQMLPPAPSVSSDVFEYLSNVDFDDEGSVGTALMKPPPPATPLDRLVDWVLSAWRDPDPLLDRVPGVLDQMGTALPSVRDWAADTGTDPTRLSWEEAQGRSLAWHRDRFVGANLGEPAPDALIVVRDEEGWTLQRLLTRKHFIVEGGAMGHCVGGPRDNNGQPSGESHYIQASRDGRGAFFSVRHPDGRIAATIEARLSASPEAPSTIVQVQGPEDGPVASDAQTKIASLFAEAGEPLLPFGLRFRPKLGGIEVVAQRNRLAVPTELPAMYADAFLYGSDGIESFDASVEEGLGWAADRAGTWGNEVGSSVIFHAIERWFVGHIRVYSSQWFGFSLRISGGLSLQFRRSTPENWATAIGPFTPGIGPEPTTNRFVAAESPAAAVLLSLSLPISSTETSRQLYPELSDAARARVYSGKLGPLSPSRDWTMALAGPG